MNKQHKYHQAKLKILNQISNYGLKKGDLLPSQSELMKNADFSMICLRRALNELEKDGVISKHQGKRASLAKDLHHQSHHSTILFLHIYDKYPEQSREYYTIKNYLAERGINLCFMGMQRPELELAKACKDCLGIFLIGWITREWVDYLKMLDVPVMVIGSNPFPEYFSSVNENWSAACKLAYRELTKRGCRKIGLINGSKDYVPALEIYQKFKEEVQKNGEKFSDKMVAWTDRKQIGQPYFAISEFLNRKLPFDALILESGSYIPFLVVSHELHSGYDYQIASMMPSYIHLGAFKLKKQLIIKFEQSLYLSATKLFLNKLETGDRSIEHIRKDPIIIE